MDIFVRESLLSGDLPAALTGRDKPGRFMGLPAIRL